MSDVMERLKLALADRYAIEHELGAGGMATVYLAEDLKHHRKVAVKVLRPELAAVLGAERFLKEIEVTANLQHPHILPLFDSGEADSFLYYVMPYVEGESLRDKLNRDKQLGIEETVEIAKGVAAALDYAHRHGVIHRDIKPENILIHDGQPVVADFGIALAVTAAGGTRLTETGLSLGTPQYMSPEQATGEREVTAKSDVYSLGAVVYEMLVGDPPHTGSTVQAIIAKVVSVEPTPITDVRHTAPRNVDAAVQKALAKVPADRFARATEFAEALSNPAFTLPTMGPGLAPSSPVALSSGPWKVLAIAATSVAILLAVTTVWGLLTSGESSPVVRFEFTTPDDLSMIVDRGPPFAISPDGSQMAYVGVTQAGSGQLYLRAIDRIGSVPIPGTEGGRAPFFSPDGESVGFFADGRLKTVDLPGGEATTLATGVADGFTRAFWGSDGYIVYAAFDYTLHRIHEQGGDPESLRPTGYDLGMFAPTPLTDGRTLLFKQCVRAYLHPSTTRRGFQCYDHSVAVLDMVEGNVEVLVADAVGGWVTPTGHLVYVTPSGSVRAAPFDRRRLKLQASAVQVLEGVALGAFSEPQMVLSQAGAMAFVPEPLRGTAQVVAVDQLGNERVVIAKPGMYSDPRLSPDGGRLALSVDEPDGGSHIWVYDLNSTTLSQLTFEGRNVRPTWSHDGSRVAFNTNRRGIMEIFWKPADGSGPAEPVVANGPSSRSIITPFLTRDGKWLLADLPSEGGMPDDIYAVPMDGTDPVRAIVADPGQDQAPAVSPDGQWLAYSSDESGQNQIYIREFPEPSGRWQISTNGGATPVWVSPHEVSYVTTDEYKMVIARLELAPASARVVERRTVFDVSSYGLGFAIDVSTRPQHDVSADGRMFVLVKYDPPQRRNPIVVLNWFEELKAKVGNE